MRNKSLTWIVQGAIIAAIYVVLTIAFAPISYGQIQVRISEILTVLPAFTPAAIPGLFIGCIAANIYGGAGAIDVVFGSLATLIAAILSSKMPKRWLVPLPPVVINGLVIGWVLNYVLGYPLLFSMLTVALGQLVACYGLGYPLMIILEKYQDRIFK